MSESAYQAGLIKRLRTKFPGCVVLKNDTSYQQGIPDLSIFYNDRWAMLEVKAASNSRHQPNQDHHVKMFDDMSFAAFIHPENEEEVLDALQQSFQPRRQTRVS